MKKTGLEIVEMIARGETPNKIKNKYNDLLMWNSVNKTYEIEIGGPTCLDLLDVLNDEFEIIEEQKVWKPRECDEYYVINSESGIEKRYWNNDEYDIGSYELGDCFRTEEEVEKTLKKIKIYTQLKRYAEEHNNCLKYEESQIKYYIYYDYLKHDLCIGGNYDHIHIGQIYFTSYELCEQAIEEIGEDNIKKLFEE